MTAHHTAVCLLLMTDQSSSSQPVAAPHVPGEGYEFDAIRKHLGGEFAAPHFVIHRNDVILGVCVGLMWHPRAESDPVEIWIGNKPELVKWGKKLAEATGRPIPVYVRREEGGKWFFTGMHEVTGSTTEPEALKQRRKPPTIVSIAQVIFLKKV